ncbi:hypothetical protein [uncultured Tateyamaria sp.]|uniref:hypothetical protein n=1 Tax=uncultured Tateyamaria sp. TaxID=455651 RepID=UPI0026356B33|nr:hypothetical protein [uncultured Tateyamaria sp.]
MVPLRLNVSGKSRPATPLAPQAFDYLNQLRFKAMECRAKPRADLFEACALLQVTRSDSKEAHAEALMRCLAEALGKSPRLHAPGTLEISFDEAWLVELGKAHARGDRASMDFLLGSRVLPQHRRLVHYLIGHIADYTPLA